MYNIAWLASTSVFLLLLTSAMSFYLAVSLLHFRSFDRFAGSGMARPVTAPNPLLRNPPSAWRWVPRWLANWQLRHYEGVREGGRPWSARLHRQLSSAGFSGMHAVPVFRLIECGVIALGTAAGFLYAYARNQPPIIYPVLGFSLGYLVPEYVLRRIAHKRQLSISHDLPKALDLMVVVLEAGLSIGEAIRIAARETARLGSTVGAELTETSAEMAAGLTLNESLQNLADRTGVDDVKALAALLVQSEQIGGKLGPALRASADLLTFNRRQRAEENAQKSAIKMLVPLVFLILPAMLLIILGPAAIQIVELLRSA